MGRGTSNIPKIFFPFITFSPKLFLIEDAKNIFLYRNIHK